VDVIENSEKPNLKPDSNLIVTLTITLLILLNFSWYSRAFKCMTIDQYTSHILLVSNERSAGMVSGTSSIFCNNGGHDLEAPQGKMLK